MSNYKLLIALFLLYTIVIFEFAFFKNKSKYDNRYNLSFGLLLSFELSITIYILKFF